MKKISIAIMAVMTLFITSCKDYLDINDNVNKPTAVTADLILPQALVATGLAINVYNTYGMQAGGYAANAGGYGGFNETVSYLYTPNNYSNLWPISYDNLEDYQYIIEQTDGVDDFVYFNGVARIMKAYGFQMLVDAYGDIPYSTALQGQDNLTPTYDNAAAVYASLANEIDLGVAAIHKGMDAIVAPKTLGTNDVVFQGDLNQWLQFANAVKLRLMVRGRGKVTFTNTTFDPAGFPTLDALINPGYARDNNRQNPMWNSYAWGYTGASPAKAWLPSAFMMTFYNNIRINDPGRGKKMYFQYPSTGTNRLGFESTGIPKSPEGSFWYPGTNRDGKSGGNATGGLKGPDAGIPLMTAAESSFLLSEAAVVGITTGAAGDAKSLFEDGIHAAFVYTYSLPGGGVKKSKPTDQLPVDGDPQGDATAYIAANNTNRLVNFDLALTQDQKIEAIITQKYIALNMVNCSEGWNEYRRTGYPLVSQFSGSSGTSTFASQASQSKRPDGLPTRILYPASEIQYNGANVPQGISSINTLIFWAK